MTNKEEEDIMAIELRLTAFLAVHLVTQVLDEASIIANAAKDSGQPWRYLAILKNLRSGKLGDPDDDYSFVDPQTNFVNNFEYVVNNLATSTPQKLPDNILKAIDESLIGQAIEDDFESPQSNLSKATSMFINNLFDMSEVEHIYEDPVENIVEHSETYDVKNVSMYRIVTSCVDAAINLATAENSCGTVFDNCKQNLFGDAYDNKTNIPLNYASNTEGEVAFYIHEDNMTTPADASMKDSVPSVVNESGDAAFKHGNHDILEKQNLLIYERAYLTMNRDEDSCLEDDPETLHREQKNLLMHDIDLQTETNKHDEFGLTGQETKVNYVENLTATESTGIKKDSLVHRFRIHGSRILARLRGWWRRRTPGNRMKYRVQRAARDLCPQSPSPRRRRVSSLRGNKHVFSPSPSSTALWKFNTVNEGVVNTWKEYSYESKPSRVEEK